MFVDFTGSEDVLVDGSYRLATVEAKTWRNFRSELQQTFSGLNKLHSTLEEYLSTFGFTPTRILPPVGDGSSAQPQVELRIRRKYYQKKGQLIRNSNENRKSWKFNARDVAKV